MSYSDKEVLAENASVHLQVTPLGVPGCRGVLGSHCTERMDFPARGCRVAVMGEVTLFLREKRCRDVSDCSVFGCWAQKYAATRLSAVAEYRGAVVAVARVCEAEAWAICTDFPKAATGSDLWKEIFPP